MIDQAHPLSLLLLTSFEIQFFIVTFDMRLTDVCIHNSGRGLVPEARRHPPNARMNVALASHARVLALALALAAAVAAPRATVRDPAPGRPPLGRMVTGKIAHPVALTRTGLYYLLHGLHHGGCGKVMVAFVGELSVFGLGIF